MKGGENVADVVQSAGDATHKRLLLLKLYPFLFQQTSNSEWGL